MSDDWRVGMKKVTNRGETLQRQTAHNDPNEEVSRKGVHQLIEKASKPANQSRPVGTLEGKICSKPRLLSFTEQACLRVNEVVRQAVCVDKRRADARNRFCRTRNQHHHAKVIAELRHSAVSKICARFGNDLFPREEVHKGAKVLPLFYIASLANQPPLNCRQLQTLKTPR
jgi:hypothetical protein